MKQLVEINDTVYIKFSEDNLIEFPSINLELIDFNKIKRDVIKENNKMILINGRNFNLDELINNLRVKLIKELKEYGT